MVSLGINELNGELVFQIWTYWVSILTDLRIIFPVIFAVSHLDPALPKNIMMTNIYKVSGDLVEIIIIHKNAPLLNNH